MKKLYFVVALVAITSVSFAKSIGFGGSMHVEQIPLYDVFDSDEIFYLSASLMPAIRVPIVLNDKFSIEPELCIWQENYYYSSDDEDYDYSYNGILGIYNFNIYLKMLKKYGSMVLYPGIRLGVQYAEYRTEYEYNGDSNEYIEADRNQIIGLLYGGEYFLNERFSIGGEAQLNYTLIDIDNNSSVSLVTTAANIIFRWYL